MIETNFNYLPTPYRCAIERLDSSGVRERRQAHADLRQWCDAYATTYGLPFDDTHHDYVVSAIGIANRRFYLS